MRKLKSKDEVVVIAGKDKGSRGVILKILSSGKCLVKGINLVKKHKKPVPQKNIPGEIVTIEAPIDASNLSIWNVNTDKPDRVKFKVLKSGAKVRVYKSDKKEI